MSKGIFSKGMDSLKAIREKYGRMSAIELGQTIQHAARDDNTEVIEGIFNNSIAINKISHQDLSNALSAAVIANKPSAFYSIFGHIQQQDGLMAEMDLGATLNAAVNAAVSAPEASTGMIEAILKKTEAKISKDDLQTALTATRENKDIFSLVLLREGAAELVANTDLELAVKVAVNINSAGKRAPVLNSLLKREGAIAALPADSLPKALSVASEKILKQLLEREGAIVELPAKLLPKALSVASDKAFKQLLERDGAIAALPADSLPKALSVASDKALPVVSDAALKKLLEREGVIDALPAELIPKALSVASDAAFKKLLEREGAIVELHAKLLPRALNAVLSTSTMERKTATLLALLNKVNVTDVETHISKAHFEKVIKAIAGRPAYNALLNTVLEKITPLELQTTFTKQVTLIANYDIPSATLEAIIASDVAIKKIGKDVLQNSFETAIDNNNDLVTKLLANDKTLTSLDTKNINKIAQKIIEKGNTDLTKNLLSKKSVIAKLDRDTLKASLEFAANDAPALVTDILLQNGVIRKLDDEALHTSVEHAICNEDSSLVATILTHAENLTPTTLKLLAESSMGTDKGIANKILQNKSINGVNPVAITNLLVTAATTNNELDMNIVKDLIKQQGIQKHTLIDKLKDDPDKFIYEAIQKQNEGKTPEDKIKLVHTTKTIEAKQSAGEALDVVTHTAEQARNTVSASTDRVKQSAGEALGVAKRFVAGIASMLVENTSDTSPPTAEPSTKRSTVAPKSKAQSDAHKHRKALAQQKPVPPVRATRGRRTSASKSGPSL